MRDRICVVGTWDTKGAELDFVAGLLAERGLRTLIVDLSTQSPAAGLDVTAETVASCHPGGRQAVLTGDRGSAVAAMGRAFAGFLGTCDDVAGVIGLGGSGGTAMITQGMRALPVGLPKLMVSTMASGQVAPYVGPSDITMMPSVTDVAGLNRISRRIYANAAGAMAGRVAAKTAEAADLPALGLSMFGVTTPCVERVARSLSDRFDSISFHATGNGGQAMEKLAEGRLVAGLLDLTTTEVADLLFGGVLPATEDRFGAVARSGLPYLGSCGALDMVNFGGPETVPARYAERKLYAHNPQITLMRTTPEENALMGEWIARRLNACEGPVVFLLPEGGVSALDAPGMAFHDPEADQALFAALEAHWRPGPRRRLVRLPHHINDPAFADRAVAEFLSLLQEA